MILLFLFAQLTSGTNHQNSILFRGKKEPGVSHQKTLQTNNFLLFIVSSNIVQKIIFKSQSFVPQALSPSHTVTFRYLIGTNSKFSCNFYCYL